MSRITRSANSRTAGTRVVLYGCESSWGVIQRAPCKGGRSGAPGSAEALASQTLFAQHRLPVDHLHHCRRRLSACLTLSAAVRSGATLPRSVPLALSVLRLDEACPPAVRFKLNFVPGRLLTGSSPCRSCQLVVRTLPNPASYWHQEPTRARCRARYHRRC